MEVDKGKLKTALPSVSLEVWQNVEKNVQETDDMVPSLPASRSAKTL